MRSVYLPPWRIDLHRRADVPHLVPDSVLARVVAAALDAGGAPRPASLALTLADDRELAELNGLHMGKQGPTDVLSFPLLPTEAFRARTGCESGMGRAAPDAARFPLPPGARQPLGDVIVSVERAVAQAEAGLGGQTGDVRWTPAEELLLLVTHGTLHVCGWDHAEPADEAAMRALERELLR